jgi:hypothetical protein
MPDSSRQFGGTSTYEPRSLIDLNTKRLEQASQAEAIAEAARAEDDAARMAEQEKAEAEAMIAEAAEPFETAEPPEAEPWGSTSLACHLSGRVWFGFRRGLTACRSRLKP